MAQNDSEQPISLNLQLFQSFPTKVAQNDLEWLILPDSQLSPSFATKASQFWRNLKNFCSEVAQNDPQWPILLMKWLRLAQNGQFWLNFNNNLNISVES